MNPNTRTYLAKAKQWALGETKNGKEQIAVSFNILTPDADVNAITWYGYFTEATWERTVESLRNCGWEGSDLATIDGLDKNDVELVIEDDTYEGQTRAKVRWVNKPGGLALTAPLHGDKLKAFSAVMQERIKGMGPTSKPKAKPPAHSRPTSDEPPPLTDDDIPF